MLKDALGKLLESQNSKQECKLGRIIADLDSDTAQALVEALKSDVSTMSLIRALASEGIPIGREFLALKRNNCFKNPDTANLCCISNRLGVKNGKQ